MTDPVTIAILAGQLVVGGAERQLYLWLSNLDRSRFQPVVLTLHPGHDDYWEGPIRELGIPLHPVEQKPDRVSRLFEIIRILRPYHPALVQGWHLFASPYAGVAAKVLGARSLGGLRDMYQTFWKHPTEARLTLWLTDAILANSHSAAKDLEGARVRKKHLIFAVQNAVVPDHFERSECRHKLDPENKLSSKPIWIGTINRLDQKKRLERYLELISMYQDREDVHFFLIGDGPQRKQLEEYAGELGVHALVTFTGEIPMASNLLPAFDVFCFTSADEGMPNVVLEAAAASVPVLAWKYPFTEEVLTDRLTGLLVEPDSLKRFKEDLDRLIANPDYRVSLGLAAREQILRQFGLERYINEMTGVYEILLEKDHQAKAKST